MKVDAALWFESPGAYADIKSYRSIGEVLSEFEGMRDTWQWYGGSKPIGVIYAADNLDCPLYVLEVTDRGRIVKEHA